MEQTVIRPYDTELDRRLYEYVGRTHSTYKDVASELGLTPEGLAKKRRGDSPIRLDEAAKLAKILGVSIEEIRHMTTGE